MPTKLTADESESGTILQEGSKSAMTKGVWCQAASRGPERGTQDGGETETGRGYMGEYIKALQAPAAIEIQLMNMHE